MLMKTLTFLLGAGVAAFTFASVATEPLLSPRAAGNQIRVISQPTQAASTSILHVDAQSALRSPRAAANQIKVVKGSVTNANPALACLKMMKGTPKAVAECSSHANMPDCVAAMR